MYTCSGNEEIVQHLTRLLYTSLVVIVLTFFYWPCPWLRPPGDYFRTTKTGVCLLKKPKAFSRQGSYKKMLMRYDMILQYSPIIVLFYPSCLRLPVRLSRLVHLSEQCWDCIGPQLSEWSRTYCIVIGYFDLSIMVYQDLMTWGSHPTCVTNE